MTSMVAPRNVPTHPLSDYGTEMSAGQQFFIGRFEHSISNKPNRLRLHRHTYYEVFWVDGRGSFLADFREYLVAGPWLIFASRGQVHRWNQKPRILEALSRTLALELAPRRVNTVCPGFIDTGKLWKDLPVEEGAAKLRAKAASDLQTTRVGLPGDAAKSYLYAIQNSYVTGKTIIVDGAGSLT